MDGAWARSGWFIHQGSGWVVIGQRVYGSILSSLEAISGHEVGGDWTRWFIFQDSERVGGNWAGSGWFVHQCGGWVGGDWAGSGWLVLQQPRGHQWDRVH